MWTDASRFARVRPETVVLIALRIDPKAVPVVRWLDPVLQQASKQASPFQPSYEDERLSQERGLRSAIPSKPTTKRALAWSIALALRLTF